MELFAQQVMNGLVLGSVYSLVALGVTLIYGTMEIPNFAHGHLYMLGAYVTFAAVTGLDLHYWIGMVLAVAAVARALRRSWWLRRRVLGAADLAPECA